MDTALEVTYQILHFVDWQQTLFISRHYPEYFERNKFLGEHPTVSEVNVYMGANAIFHALFSIWLDKPYRTIWQGVTLIDTGYNVYHNHRIGIAFSWTF